MQALLIQIPARAMIGKEAAVISQIMRNGTRLKHFLHAKLCFHIATPDPDPEIFKDLEMIPLNADNSDDTAYLLSHRPSGYPIFLADGEEEINALYRVLYNYR